MLLLIRMVTYSYKLSVFLYMHKESITFLHRSNHCLQYKLIETLVTVKII